LNAFVNKQRRKQSIIRAGIFYGLMEDKATGSPQEARSTPERSFPFSSIISHSGHYHSTSCETSKNALGYPKNLLVGDGYGI
jgi:hypothetical protein